MAQPELRFEVEGRFKIEAFKTDADGMEIPGSRRVVSPWNKNLILDAGLNRMATSGDYIRYCQVGSGSSVPATGQVSLDSLVAGVEGADGALTVAPSAPYYVSRIRSYTFATGVAAGNLSEVGVGWALSGTTLFSRSLIKDSGGNPTTITILPDESLNVIYEFRYYGPPTDITGTVVATGNIGGSYDYVLRAASFATANVNSWNLPASQQANAGGLGVIAYSGPIGPVTGVPSGTTSNLANASPGTYVSGSFQLDRVVTAQAEQANFGTGLRSIKMQMGIGVYQIEFTPPIPKTNVDVVSLTMRISWGRRP